MSFLHTLNNSGLLVVPIWLFRDFAVPVIHFILISHLSKNKVVSYKIIVLSCMLLIVATLANSILVELLIYHGSMVVSYGTLRIIWILICGILILSHTVFYRRVKNKKLASMILFVEMVFVLVINATARYLVISFFSIVLKYYINDIEKIIAFFVTSVMLSLYSYLLGNTMKKENSEGKLGVWLIGIMISIFIEMTFWGYIPVKNILFGFVWLIISIIVFLAGVLGVVMNKHMD